MNRSNSDLRPPKPHQIPPPPPEPEDGLGRFIGISVAVHAVVVAMFTLKVFFFPSEPIQLERAIRVDMVGLPDKKQTLPPELKEPPKEAKSEPPKAEPPKPEPPKPEPPAPKVALPDKPAPAPKPDSNKVNLNKTKQAQENALKRLEALNKIESMMKESNSKPNSNTAKAQEAVVKGNEISPGSALTGIARLENESYLRSLKDLVHKNWHVPNFLANANLKATAIVFIDERGNIIKKHIGKSSGNQIFDQTVITAVEQAAPFPAPPPRLAGIFMVKGVEIGFPD